MAQARNTFIRSKLNKDLDARLMPQGEYRDALNIQVSKSEGSSVGSLENVLGTSSILDIRTSLNVDGLTCIGQLVDESAGQVYLFLTDNFTNNYKPASNNFIIRVTVDGTVNNNFEVLVKGSFLNFSSNYKIYASNLLEGLLFWTDNYNQPRVINTTLANPDGLYIPTYYTTEDQISVAKYNPFQSIELWQEVSPATSPSSYETTMKDVTSKALPNGGTGFSAVDVTTPATALKVTGFTGEIPASQYPQNPGTPQTQNMLGNSGINYLGAQVGYIDNTGSVQLINNGDAYVYNWTYVAAQPPPLGILEGLGDIRLTSTPGGQTQNVDWPVGIIVGTEIVFNPNPYYDKNFAGDENYLEDKFVRFSYRFKFQDNEYSLMAPFTQIAFIPKQDGYFTYIKEVEGIQGQDDQTASYRSSVVSFMENKVDDIKLRIPLPFSKATISNALKIQELEILYKESDGLAVKVIDTIPVNELTAGTGADTAFVYNYISKKPVKTLPSNQLTRVYDKIPVRAFSQEIASNRIVYGNFQNKHTPPAFLDYNVGINEKYLFNLQNGTLTITSTGSTISPTSIAITVATGVVLVGSFVTGAGVPNETQILSVTGTSPNITAITLNKNVTLTAGDILTVTAVGDNTETVSIVEYPNSTIKQNRTYQVGVVLSDRYGRSSSVILSSNDTATDLGAGIGAFGGDTIYSPYLNSAVNQNTWVGNSLKVLFNSIISSPKNISLGIPGLYNGAVDSDDYNPLGWYSYKIVVKQTEQEYYNIYLPGIMAAYPTDTILELGKTSHAVLINDNINKIPRDLSEVGPEQRQFRSSVQLFGRVENVIPNQYVFEPGENLKFPANVNDQYYPGRKSHTVSTVSTVGDLFDYNPNSAPTPNDFPQFYLLNSNPLVARISTNKQIGQIATTNYITQGGVPGSDNFLLPGIPSSGAIPVPNSGGPNALELQERTIGPNTPFNIFLYRAQTGSTGSPGEFDVKNGDAVTSTAGDIPEGTHVIGLTYPSSGGDPFQLSLSNTVTVVSGGVLSFSRGEGNSVSGFTGTPQIPGLQYLAVYETEPVESLLDIFWETSTSGLINSLNNLILNDTGGSAGLSNINTNPWTEGLALGGNIFESEIFFENSFGGPFGNTEIVAGSIVINSAFNNASVNVQLSNPYFLINEIGNGGFQITTTQAYHDIIYFFSNVAERLFTFTVQATVIVDGVTSVAGPFSFGPIGPGNISPTLTRQAPQSGSTIVTDRNSSQPVATLNGINGANNVSLRANMTHAIFSVTDTINQTNVTTQNYFILDTTLLGPTDPTNPNTLKAELRLNLGTIPASNFRVIINSADEGGIQQQVQTVYDIDLTIVPAQVATGQYTCNDQSGNSITYQFVYIEITGVGPFVNGHYVWYTNALSNIANGNTVTIDNTNAITSASQSCPPFTIPFYSGASLNAALEFFGQGDCSQCTSTPGSHGTLSNVPNFTNYDYEIV